MTRGAWLFRQPWLAALTALIVLSVVSVALQPSFLRPDVLQSNLTTFLPLVLVAIGQTYVVLAGDIDLSVGSTVALVNVVAVSVMAAAGAGPGAVAAGLMAGAATGVACGLVNGALVALLRLQPVVATFATSIVFSGLALWVLPQAGLPAPEPYWRGYGGGALGVPTVMWVLGASVLVTAVVVRRPFMNQLLAAGGNRTAAFQTGLRLSALRMAAFVICGLFAAAAALCLVGETASGDPLLGQSLSLSAISAVVLGGTALAGGSGSAFGSILGALLLGLIGNVIFFAGLPFAYQTLAQGLIILAALAGGVLIARRPA